jgi:hypothetical protein
MPAAISNTSPLLYLYRIGVQDWLKQLFGEIWIPGAVVSELTEGQRRGYDVPNPSNYEWIRVVEPRSMPSELIDSIIYRVYYDNDASARPITVSARLRATRLSTWATPPTSRCRDWAAASISPSPPTTRKAASAGIRMRPIAQGGSTCRLC